MDTDELEIKQFLRGFAGQWVSGREVCRRVGRRRRYHDDPHWAMPVLGRLVEQGIVESDSLGHYRLVRVAPKQRPRVWMSPHLRKILERSGREFGGVFELDDDEEKGEKKGSPADRQP